MDFGIRGVHLAYELLNGYDGLVLVDAVPMDEARERWRSSSPTMTTGERASDAGGGHLDAHSMSPDVVLATLARLGGSIERMYVVGCQPATLEEGIGLSPPVAAAVDGAVALCRRLVAEIAQPKKETTQ